MKKIKLLRHALISDNVKPDLAGTVMTVGDEISKDRAEALVQIGYAEEVAAPPAPPAAKDKAAAPENKAKGK